MLRSAMMAGVAVLGLYASSAQAGILYISGTTLGAPTYNRALEDFSALSLVGTDVAYSVDAFTVSVSGDYGLLSQADNFWDNFLFLYTGSFNPGDALTNGIAGNDDLGFVGYSGIGPVALTTGITYYAVTTGFGNGDAGKYGLLITGPGDITPPPPVVPEPATWGMMLAGLAVVGYAMRRYQTVRVSFG